MLACMFTGKNIITIQFQHTVPKKKKKKKKTHQQKKIFNFYFFVIDILI